MGKRGPGPWESIQIEGKTKREVERLIVESPERKIKKWHCKLTGPQSCHE